MCQYEILIQSHTSRGKRINFFRYSGGKVLTASQGHTTTTPTFLDYFGLSQSQYNIIYDQPINTAPIRSIFVTVGVTPWPKSPVTLQVNPGMPQPTTPMFMGLSDTFLGKLSAVFTRQVSGVARGGGNFKRVHDSIKPAVWSRRFVAKFV